MIKKTATAAALCAILAVFGDAAGAKKEEEKILKFGRIEWDAVKKCVDTNGYCRIPDQNAAIVITNGLPDVERALPAIKDRLDRSPLRPAGRRGGKNEYRPRPEPMPYFGQGL